MLQRGRYDKRALLVVTDGMDNTSGHSLDDVVALARRQGVLIGIPLASAIRTPVQGWPFR